MSTAPAGRGTILVVDDCAASIDQLVALLSGYEVIAATSGGEALDIVAAEPVELILLDIVMPGIDGLETCQRLRASASSRDIPVVFVTGRDDERVIDAAYAAGADDYVTKPFRRVELLARVRTHLARYRQLLQLRLRNQALSQTRHALAQSEERYRLAMESARDGVWDWDLVSGEVYYSPGWERIVGEPAVVPGIDNWQTRVHPDDRDAVVRSLQAYVAGGDEDWVSEHRLRHANGDWIWVAASAQAASRDDAGRALRIVGTFNDIGERKRNDLVNALQQQLGDLMRSGDLHTLMRASLDAAEHATGSEIGFYHFVDEDEESIALQVWSTRTLQEMCSAGDHEQHYPVDQAGVWVDCIRQRRVVVHNDYAALPHKRGLPEGHPPVRSELTVPVFREGRIVAVIGVGNKPVEYDANDIDVVSRIANITHGFMEWKRIEQRNEYMAFNDSLTGLPNKDLLYDRMRQAMPAARRAGKLLAICYLDLDGFKPVNDRLGHHAGDRLLTDLARRLEAELRDGDTVARLGGDEFVLLLNNLQAVYDGERILKRVLQSVGEPFDIEGESVFVTASIGVTFFPVDDCDPDTLLRHADKAMYKAKEAGRSVFRLYDPVQEDEIRRRLKLYKQLERAVPEKRLELHYQPRIDLRNGELVSVEALLRWNHAEHGQMLPGSFLQLMQGRALEFEIGRWVIRSAVNQHLAWRDSGLSLPVSINISPQQLMARGFAAEVSELLVGEAPDVGSNLEFEVLESAAAKETEVAAETVRDCRKLGIRFALDDFGTGYASLMRFHNLPVDILKIDQQFVRGMMSDERHLGIVEGVVRLAHNLGNPVVAEGVESIETGIMLMQLGCQFAQGFAIARPMPADQVARWAADWSAGNAWRDLPAQAEQLPGRHDLGVAVFGHRVWLERFVTHVNARRPDVLAQLGPVTCPFDTWYHGIGGARYGDLPGFAFLPPKHQAVHEIADRIAERVARGDFAAAEDGLDRLRNASRQLIDALTRLAG